MCVVALRITLKTSTFLCHSVSDGSWNDFFWPCKWNLRNLWPVKSFTSLYGVQVCHYIVSEVMSICTCWTLVNPRSLWEVLELFAKDYVTQFRLIYSENETTYSGHAQIIFYLGSEKPKTLLVIVSTKLSGTATKTNNGS